MFSHLFNHSLFRRGVHWIPLLLVLGILSVWYFQTMPPGMSSHQVGGWTDAAAMQVVGSYWGIAHSPGYPLYTILSNLFSRALGIVPSIPEPAWRVSFFSVLSGLAALGLLYSILLKARVHPILACAAALVLGTGATFWFYAVTAEVYMMNLVLILLCVRLALAWKDAEGERAYLLAIGLLMGALAAHHRTGLLVAPVLLGWMVLSKRDGWRAWLGRAGWIVVAAVPGMLSYLYLPLTARLNEGWTRLYGDASNPAEFWFIVLSREWWGLVKLPSSLPEVWDRLVWLARQQSAEVGGPVLLGLGVAGLLVTAKRAWLLGGVAALFAVFGTFYWVDDLNSMLIPLTAMLVAGVALGTQKVGEFAAKGGPGGRWIEQLVPVGMALLLLVLGLRSAGATAERVDQSDDTVGVDMVQTLQILAEDGIPMSVIAEGNTSLAIAQYARARYRLGNMEPLSATVMRSWYPAGAEGEVESSVDADRRIRGELYSRWEQGQGIYYDAEVEELALVPEISSGLAEGRYLSTSTHFPDLKRLLPAGQLPPPGKGPRVSISLPMTDGLSLIGYDQRWIFKRSGVHLRVALYWQCTSVVEGNWVVWLQPTGTLSEALSGAEYEGFLLGSYPVSRLGPGEVLRDVYELRLNQLPEAFAPAELEVGLVPLQADAPATTVRIPIEPFQEPER